LAEARLIMQMLSVRLSVWYVILLYKISKKNYEHLYKIVCKGEVTHGGID